MATEREAMLRRAADELNEQWAESRARFDAWVAAGGKIYGRRRGPTFGDAWKLVR